MERILLSTGKSKFTTFAKWSRKPFAVFTSLNAIVKISVLSGTLTILSIPEKGYSQQDTIQINKHLDIDEVIVNGERAPEVYSKVSRIVTLIPKNDLNHSPVQSLQDQLEYIPSVDLRLRGKYGVQADLSIRGGSFDQNLILLNGINISDPQTGHLALSLPIDIESVDHIEILEGPSSRIFGANAFSGAINFVTSNDSVNKISAHLMGGQHGLYKTSISGSLSSNYLSNYFAISRSSSDGYIHNTDFNNLNLYYNASTILEKARLSFQAGLTSKSFGSNSFYGAQYKDQYEENTASLVSLNVTTGEKLKLTSSVYWRRMDDHFVLIRTNPEVYQNFHLTDVLGQNLNVTYSSFIGNTTLGTEIRSETIHSNRLGEPVANPIPVKGQDSIYYTNFHSRTNFGIFVEHSYHQNRFDFSAGGLFNLNTDQGINADFYPGIDLSFAIFEHSKIYTSVNKSLRLPTFTDLYYQGPANIGNVNLKPEIAISYETGYKFSGYGITGNLSYFYRKGTNIIDWLWNSTDSKWHTQNLTQLNTYGFEVQSRMDFSQLIDPNFRIRTINAGYSFIDQTKADKAVVSHYALDYLKDKLVFGMDHRILSNLYANWQITYQNRNGTYLEYIENTAQSTEESYNPFWLVDGRVYWEKPNLTVYTEVSNIFNVQYADLGNVNQPGRWFRAGIKANLNFSGK